MSIAMLKNFVNNYFDFNYGIACVIGIIIFCGYLYIIKRRNESQGQNISKKELFCGLALSIYLVLLLGGTLLNRHIGEEYGIEWKLFWSYREAYAERNESLIWQMIYNVLVFIPWGFLLAEIWKVMRKFHWNVGSALVFSALIELTQLVFRCGLFEFDDIFHNVLGAVIGYGVWRLWKKGNCRRMSVKKGKHKDV